MAEQFQPKSVKDVPKDLFIKAYAEHLKANDKVQNMRYKAFLLLHSSRCVPCTSEESTAFACMR